MRRILGVRLDGRLVAALLVLGLAAWAAPSALVPATADAQAGPHRWVRTPGVLATTTGPEDAEIPVTLDYDVYVPDSATALTRQPAVVVAHGFGGAKDNAELLTLAAFFASHGYVVLASSHMGFGGSSGCIALDLADYDGRNVASLVDVLAGRPDVLQEAPGDPVVGMIGGSYGGGHQGGVAAIDDRVDAIAPHRTWNALQYSLVPDNRVTAGMWDLDASEQGVFKQGWTSLFYALGSTQPLMGGGGCDPVTQQTLYPGQPPCPGFDPRVCPIFAGLTSTGDVTAEQRALIAGGAMATYVDRVDVPVLLQQGQSDTLFTLTEAFATYEALDARGIDVDLIMNSGGHGYPPMPGEGEPYSGVYDDTDGAQAAFGATYLADRYLGFFDEHLRGVPDDAPRVAFFRSWVDYDVEATGGTAAPAYGTAPDLPVGGVTAFALDAAGPAPTLRAAAAAAAATPEPATATLIAPPPGGPSAHSETPNFSGPGQPGADIPPTEVDGQHVAFDSDALTTAVEVVGTGTVLLDVAGTSGRDVVLFTKVYDVAPGGAAVLLHRMVAASRVPADALPGRHLLRLPPVVHRFEAGHRLRLVVATTDDSYRGSTTPDQITLATGGTTGSTLSLPTATGPVVDRIAGPDRIATAVQLSRRAFTSAGTAVLASAGDFPDALSAGGLAAAIGGPLLLVGADVRDDVRAELDRLGVDRVYLAGGTGVLGAGVVAGLEGREVVRLAGEDRYATATAVAAETARVLGGVDAVLLARGDDPADALGGGSLAAQGVPVLLTRPGDLPGATAQALAQLDPDLVYVAGGSAAIAEGVVSSVGRPTQRLAGETRYATAAAQVAEAQRLLGSDGRDAVLVASGLGFADALAAGPAAHALHGLLLIVDPVDLRSSPPTAGILGQGWSQAFLVGGYAAIGQALDGQVALAVGAGGS
jgi:predicted acyl esterase